MDATEQLSTPYALTDVNTTQTTKERILLESTLMFAKHGFAAVSMRDIADKVGIQVSSLYNHFKSKDDLWVAVLAHVENLYLQYFNRLDLAINDAHSFREMLDCMFLELHSIVSLFTYYGFSLVIAEQFTDERAYKIFNELFLSYSIDFIQSHFDRAVASGDCRKFDTQNAATQFMHGVLFGIILRTNSDMGRKTPYNVDKMLIDLHSHIYWLATGEKKD